MIGPEIRTPLSSVRRLHLGPGLTLADYYGAAHDVLDHQPVVCVMDGKPVLRAEWSKVVVGPSHSVQFVIMPRGGGGTGLKSILRVVAMVALLVVANIVAPGIGSFLAGATGVGFFGTAAGISLITAGLVIGGSLLLNAIMPVQRPQDQSSTGLQASPTYNLSAQGNSARLFEPVPKLYGRHLLYPDYASQPWVLYEDNEQYLYLLLSLGVGEYDVEQVRIEDTLVWSSSGGYSGNFSDVELQIVPPGQAMTLFPASVITSVEVGGQDLADPGTWSGPYVANDAERQITRIDLDYIFTRGIYFANNNGGLSSHTVSVRAEARRIDAAGAPLSSWFLLGEVGYARATATPQRVTEKYDVTAGRYEVRVRRSSSKSTDTRYGDDVQWASLRAFVPDDGVFDDVTLLAVRMKASSQLSGAAQRKFNTVQRAKVREWDPINAWSAPVLSRNPAWAAVDALLNPVYGAGLAESRVDLTAFYQLALTAAERGDNFDAVFDTKRSIWEAITLMLRPARAQPLLVAGRITVVRDEPAEVPRLLLTSASMRAGSFELTHILYNDESPDDVIVEYTDARTWRPSEVQCTLPSSLSEKPARIQLFGITDRAQAWREGMYEAASNAYRRIFASVGVELEGRMLLRGDTLLVSHDLPNWGHAARALAFDLAQSALTLDSAVPSGVTELVASRPSGRPWGPVPVTGVSEDGLRVFLDAEALAEVEAEQGIAPFAEGFDGLREQSRVALNVPGRAEAALFKLVAASGNDPSNVTLTLAAEDVRVYEADAGEPPPEDLDPFGPGSETGGRASVASVTVAQSPLSLADPVTLSLLAVPGSPVPESYIMQSSTDGLTYRTIYEGASNTAEFTELAGPVYVRVAGLNASGRGNWVSPAVNPVSYGAPSGLPSTPQSLNVIADMLGGVLSASWQRSARATSYVVTVYIEGSTAGVYDVAKMTKEVFGLGASFSADEARTAGGPWPALRLTVAGKNATGTGVSTSDTKTGLTLPAPTSAALITPYTGVEINVQWNPVATAAQYEVQLWQGGSARASFTVATSSLLITSAAVSTAGGPWRQAELRIKSKSGSLMSSALTLSVEDTAPPVPSSISTVSPSTGRIDVSWAAVSDANLTGYRLYSSTSSGFAPGPGNQVYFGAGTSTSITGLTSGQVYYFRLRAEDSYAGGDGLLMSSEFSRIAT